jgi:hypothetical protein
MVGLGGNSLAPVAGGALAGRASWLRVLRAPNKVLERFVLDDLAEPLYHRLVMVRLIMVQICIFFCFLVLLSRVEPVYYRANSPLGGVLTRGKSLEQRGAKQT